MSRPSRSGATLRLFDIVVGLFTETCSALPFAIETNREKDSFCPLNQNREREKCPEFGRFLIKMSSVSVGGLRGRNWKGFLGSFPDDDDDDFCLFFLGPFQVLMKWGEYSSDVNFILQRTALNESPGKNGAPVVSPTSNNNKNASSRPTKTSVDPLHGFTPPNNTSTSSVSSPPSAKDLKKSLTFSGGRPGSTDSPQPIGTAPERKISVGVVRGVPQQLHHVSFAPEPNKVVFSPFFFIVRNLTILKGGDGSRREHSADDEAKWNGKVSQSASHSSPVPDDASARRRWPFGLSSLRSSIWAGRPAIRGSRERQCRDGNSAASAAQPFASSVFRASAAASGHAARLGHHERKSVTHGAERSCPLPAALPESAPAFLLSRYVRNFRFNWGTICSA